MMRFGWLPASFCSLVLASAAHAPLAHAKPALQTPDYGAPSPKLIPRSREERERRYRAEHHIILNVRAVDSFGRPVSGLRPQDFKLLDNLRPQKLTSFREVNDAEPGASTHIILMLDAVNNTARSIHYEIKEIRKFLATQPGTLAYPMSLAILTTSGIIAGPKSNDAKELWRDSKTFFKTVQLPLACDNANSTISNLFAIGVRGDQNVGFSAEKINDGSCLNQRFVLSVSALLKFATEQQNVPGRAILIWLGPGWPLLSGPEFYPDSPAVKQNLFDHLVALSTAFIEAQVTVDAISSPDMFRRSEPQSIRDKSLFDAVASEQYVTAANLSLRSLVHASGGRSIEGKDIPGYIDGCVADARTYYTLSFDSVPSAEPDEYRELQVIVNKPGVKAVTNTVYYGQP